MRAVDSGIGRKPWKVGKPVTGQWNAGTDERTKIETRFEIRLRFA